MSETSKENSSSDQPLIIDQELLKELPYFETFLNRVGFKRIDGAVYGLLVLSVEHLSSEEIEEYLGLSQSAISNSLKNLYHYGAIDFREHRDNKRIKLHYAKTDSLAIASTIFRKREQQYVEEFKAMAKRLLRKSESLDKREDCNRNMRLKSIILTCEIAESVMKFVIGVTQLDVHRQNPQILQKFPKVLDLLLKGATPLADMTGSLTEQVKSTFGHKFKEQIQKINESRKHP